MDDTKNKKGEIIDFLSAKAKKKDTQDIDNSIKVKGNNNNIAGRDIYINKRDVTRTTFQPGDEHITQRQAKAIKDLVANLVMKEEAGGMDRARAFKKWWSVLKNRYAVTTYLAIPAHLGDEAISWLQQQSAIKRPKIRRGDNDAWRKELYKAIWARARQIGISKGEVYALALNHLGKRVTSLKQLREQNLKALHGIVMRQR